MTENLQKTAEADERFAQRFPDRRFWVRPASRGEVRTMFRGKVRGWHPCVVIARYEGDVYAHVPFLCTSRDISDAYEEGAAEIFLKAMAANKAGSIAKVLAVRSGRPI